jgi:tetratricopeptide (TPR) repeat protein
MTIRSSSSLVPLLVVSLAACAGGDAAPPADPVEVFPDGAEAVSFLGDALYAPTLSEGVLENHTRLYQEAESTLVENPEDVDALIWMGRRTAYLGRYRDALDIYTRAIGLHPDDARLYRHRGHRYVSVRELDHAIMDLGAAAELTRGEPDEIEPDGLPNVAGIPTSTLQFNIWYHLGLALYLKGDFEAAADAYATCAEVSEHPDSKVATAYWRAMTLRRLGREAEARAVMADITPDMEVIESGGYLDLILLHKGERSVEDILGPPGEVTLESTTAGYGVGAWYLIEGNREEAHNVFQRVLAGGDQWAAFGFIAAEAELSRWTTG